MLSVLLAWVSVSDLLQTPYGIFLLKQLGVRMSDVVARKQNYIWDLAMMLWQGNTCIFSYLFVMMVNLCRNWSLTRKSTTYSGGTRTCVTSPSTTSHVHACMLPWSTTSTWRGCSLLITTAVSELSCTLVCKILYLTSASNKNSM